MKKKHLQYKLGLFISLLSLNTLSSCVHTRQSLAVDGTLNGQEEQSDNRDSFQGVSRLSLIRTNLSSIVRPLADASPESVLFIICGATYVASYCLGYYLGYNPGYADGLLHAYLEPKVSK